MRQGLVYLIPNTLGNSPLEDVLPPEVVRIIGSLNHFVVENEKTARAFLKRVQPDKPQREYHIELLDKHTEPLDIPPLLKPVFSGHSIGILSEAGVPCVADPGSELVSVAHRQGVVVRPLVGPSSILLALMASGFNGQMFTFKGYLPHDKALRKKMFQHMEREIKQGTTQIFMETPYRNNKLVEELTAVLHPETRLCIAADITLETEFIKTQSLARWAKNLPDLHKRPALFLLD